MKNLQTGEITPPLDHEEYQEEFQANVEAERRERAKSAKGNGARKPPSRPAKTEEEPEPEFHGNPLSFYDDLSDEQITSIQGIAEGTLAKIRDAQKKRDKK